MFLQLCQSIKNSTWVVNYDKGLKGAYAVNNETWVSYEDPQSAKDKVSGPVSN